MSPFQTRKSVHINLTCDTHSAFKIFAFQNSLSMQEIFEELAIRMVEGDSKLLRLIDDIKDKKRDKEISRISKTDADTIYDVISDLDPLNGKE